MTHQQPAFHTGTADAGAEIAQLRHVLALVEEIGGGGTAAQDADLDEAARVSAAYEAALPIVQRRFDGKAAETARWTAVCIEALVRLREHGRPTAAASARLASELRRALAELRAIVSA